MLEIVRRCPKRFLLMIALTLALAAFITLLVFAKAPPLVITWLPLAPLPEALVGGRAVVISDTLYVIGGSSQLTRTSAFVSAQIDGYNTITKWNSINSSLPISLDLHALVKTTDTIYTIGGWNGLNRYAKVWKAPLTGTLPPNWTEVRNYPRKIVLHSAVYADNRIYVLGGVDENNQPLKEVYSALVKDATLEPWLKNREEMSHVLFRFSAAAYRWQNIDYVYITGGYDGQEARREVYRGTIDSTTHELGTWKKVSTLPHAMYYHETVVYGDRLVVIGGKNDRESFNQVYSALIQSNGDLGEWVTETALPLSLSRFAAVVVTPPAPTPAIIYLFGGLHDNIYQSQVYRSEPPTPTPTHTPTPTPTHTPTPTYTPTPTHTPTPTVTPGLAILALINQPDHTLAPGDTASYTIVYQNGPYTLDDFTLSNKIPDYVELIPASIQSTFPVVITYTGVIPASRITWRFSQGLTDNQHGSVSYQVQRPTSTPTVSLPDGLSITKSGPQAVQSGSGILYTLTVFNNRPQATTNLRMLDQIPEHANYVGGGVRMGDFVQWNDLPDLEPYATATRTFLVTATQTITNSNYLVTADGNLSAIGAPPVVTLIVADPSSFTSADLIINTGAEALWNYQGQPDSMTSNAVFNPAQKVYLPLAAR